MNTRSLVVAIVAALLLASGCKSKPTLVGEWTGTMPIQGFSVDTKFVFGADGTLAVIQTMGGQGSTQKGTYKEEEKTFTVIPTSFETPSLSKATLDQLNAALAKNAKPMTFTLVWTDADTIVVTQQGAPVPLNLAITLKRKK